MKSVEKRIVKNKGSAIIEMTLLIPVILGVIYLYIMLFLFLVQSAQYQEIMVKALYVEKKESVLDTENVNLTMSTQGGRVGVFIDDSIGEFDIDLEMHRKEDNAVKNIRRWQLAADTLRAGTDE